MEAASSDLDDIEFDIRKSNERFQRQLLEAQQDATDRQIEADLVLHDRIDDDGSLDTERASLQAQIQRANAELETLRAELNDRRAKRAREAELTKMTPEERALALEKEDEDDSLEADEDVIFDYLLCIGGAPLPKNAADMSGSNFISPHAEMRAKAMQDPEVKEQSHFANIHFTQTTNTLLPSTDTSSEIRHCELKGQSFDIPFSVAFNVHEPSLLVDNLAFEVDIEVQLKIGALLEQIKEECDLLSFFRLIVHYARLDHERKKVFRLLRERFSNTAIRVSKVDEERLSFLHREKKDEPELVLSWIPRVTDSDREDVSISICERVLPDLRLEAELPESWQALDEQDIFMQLPDQFSNLVTSKGVLLATQMMVSMLLQVDII